MTKRLEARERATRLLEELRRRARRQNVVDALALAVVDAWSAGVLGAFFLSATWALGAILIVFLALAPLFLALVYWRTPGVWGVARRLEALAPQDDGVLTASLDPSLAEDDSELAVETLARALRLLEAWRATSCDALRLALYSGVADPNATRRRALFRKRLGFVATTLTLLCATTIFQASRREANRPATPSEPSATTETVVAPSASEPKERSRGAVKTTLGADATTALVAELQRALALARSLADTLTRSSPEDVALAIELARELESNVASETGIVARASGVAELAAGTLRAVDPDLRAFPAALASRRARELIAYFQGERENRGAFLSALNESLRGAAEAERREGRRCAKATVDALIERLTDEVAAFSILDEGGRFQEKTSSAEVVGESLRDEAVRLLTLRAGLFPDGRTEEEARDFFDLLANRRAAWLDALADYDALAIKLGAPENAEFLEFAERVAQDAGMTRSLFDAPKNVRGYVEGAVKRLDVVRREALAEHWGRASTTLRTEPEYEESGETTSKRAAIALALTFGKLPESAGVASLPFAEVDAETTEGERPDASGSFADERQKSDEEASTLRALEREAALGETSALEGRAMVAERDELAIRDGSDGATSDVGARFDPNFAGGGAKAEEGAALQRGDDAFLAETPQDVRKRVERAQKWAPPEEYERRAEEFRRNLWKATR